MEIFCKYKFLKIKQMKKVISIMRGTTDYEVNFSLDGAQINNNNETFSSSNR